MKIFHRLGDKLISFSWKRNHEEPMLVSHNIFFGKYHVESRVKIILSSWENIMLFYICFYLKRIAF